MKDLLGGEVQIGNYICYALTAGRSANLIKSRKYLTIRLKLLKLTSLMI